MCTSWCTNQTTHSGGDEGLKKTYYEGNDIMGDKYGSANEDN